MRVLKTIVVSRVCFFVRSRASLQTWRSDIEWVTGLKMLRVPLKARTVTDTLLEPMGKRFQHLGEEWEATPTGTGHSDATSNRGAPISHWGVWFRSLTNPGRGDIRGEISFADPSQAPDEDLRRALEEQLVVDGIEHSHYVWRTPEALSKEVAVPIDRVRQILESSDDVMRASSPNAQGHLLYTTRDHYRKLTPFLERYFKIVAESS